MSQTVVCMPGPIVFLAGQVATDRSKSTADQTAEVLAKIEMLLAEAGSSKTQMLSATVWLADIGDFDEMNRIWDAWVPAGQAPARACVQALLAKPEIKVEIQIVAQCGTLRHS